MSSVSFRAQTQAIYCLLWKLSVSGHVACMWGKSLRCGILCKTQYPFSEGLYLGEEKVMQVKNKWVTILWLALKTEGVHRQFHRQFSHRSQMKTPGATYSKGGLTFSHRQIRLIFSISVSLCVFYHPQRIPSFPQIHQNLLSKLIFSHIWTASFKCLLIYLLHRVLF